MRSGPCWRSSTVTGPSVSSWTFVAPASSPWSPRSPSLVQRGMLTFRMKSHRTTSPSVRGRQQLLAPLETGRRDGLSGDHQAGSRARWADSGQLPPARRRLPWAAAPAQYPPAPAVAAAASAPSPHRRQPRRRPEPYSVEPTSPSTWCHRVRNLSCRSATSTILNPLAAGSLRQQSTRGRPRHGSTHVFGGCRWQRWGRGRRRASPWGSQRSNVIPLSIAA